MDGLANVLQSSCAIGDISSTKEYNFHDYDIMLRKLGTDGIHYMISSSSDTNNQRYQSYN